MAVVGEAKLLRRGGDGSETAAVNEPVTRSYTWIYRVITDAVTDGPKTVLAAAGLPHLFESYQAVAGESDDEALCVRRDPRRISDSLVWEIHCTWSTLHADEEDEENDNPLDEPPEIEWSFETFQEIVSGPLREVGPGEIEEEGENGDVVVRMRAPIIQVGFTNSAGELFDPPPLMDASRPVLTISRNVEVFDPQVAYAYDNAVNSDVFFGALPRVARCEGIKGRQMRKKRLRYWRESLKFVFRVETWDIAVLDHGTFYCDAAAVVKPFELCPPENRKPFKDKEGHPGKGNLDGQGRQLPPGLPPQWVVGRKYRELPFAPLGIEQAVNG